MGNTINNQYNKENDTCLNIILNKTCYFPGEYIEGYLDIQPKIGLNNTIFDDTSAKFNLTQIQKYSYTVGSGDNQRTVFVSDNSDILLLNLDFINFRGSNILLGIKIPFSFQIPLKNIFPTVYFYGFYIKHLISFELPGIKAKKTLMIIIKEYQNYTFENKLLKMPAIGFGDFYKKKKYNYNGGRISCLLKIPKNSYNYFEIIPFEIFLDCNELDMEIKSLSISIMKNIYFNNKNQNKKHFKTYSKKIMASKEYTFVKTLDKYHINDEIQIQQENINNLNNLNNYKNFENIFPKEIYSFFEDIKAIEIDYSLSDIILTPFCIGGLISIDFSLKVEINYKEESTSSYFELPIQLIDKRFLKLDIYNPNFNINNNIENENKINNDNNNIQNENKNKYYNINSFDEDDIIKNIEQSDDFVVFNHEDFQKLFFEGKNK